MMKFELVVDAGVVLAETPIWDKRIGKLYWTDLFTGDVHQYDPVAKNEKVFATGKMIGSAIPCQREGKLLVILENGIFVLDQASGALELVADPNGGDEKNRYNDARVDAAGRIFGSTVSKLYGSDAYQPTMLGKFFMVDTDGTVSTVVDNINQYNAICWNKENTKMFVVDTYNCKLLAFDYDLAKGPVSGPKEVIAFGELGMPDGMCIDCDDNLYVCHWTGKLSIWDKDMKQVEVVDFPVEQVCCGGFGGPDMQDLYVATARYSYSPQDLEKNPGAGGLFVARCSHVGAPDHFYK